MSLHLPTLVFQVVNFLVLGLVLWRFLWRPLRAHLAARTARIESDLRAAEKGREAARKLEAQARDAHERAQLALETAERKAEAQAEAHRQHLFEQVSREASAERDRIVEKAAHEQAKREARFLRSLGPAVARVLERILSEESVEVMRRLLAAGADPTLATDDGTTPLMVAAGLGRYTNDKNLRRGKRSPSSEAAVALLLDAGAAVDTRNEADFTALHGAAFRGLNEVIRILVERGADIDARDFRGRTPYRLAEGSKQSFYFQEFPETAALLEELGADTSLGLAAMLGFGDDKTQLIATSIEVNPPLVADNTLLGFGQMQTTVGGPGITPGDNRGALALAAIATTGVVFNAAGNLPAQTLTLNQYVGALISDSAVYSAQTQDAADNFTALFNALDNREKSISAVNIDEELSNMIVLQNSFSASARMISTIDQLFDELLQSVR